VRNSTFLSNFTAYWSTLFLYEVTVRDHNSLSDRTDPFIEGVKKCKDKEERYVWVWDCKIGIDFERRRNEVILDESC